MTSKTVDSVSHPGVSFPRLHWIHLIVFISGFSGLGYEIVWTRLLAVSLGHEIISVYAVLAAFFIGLAAGAFSFNRLLQNTRHPERYYAAFELVIALWALGLIWLIPYFNQFIPEWIGEEPSTLVHWVKAFSGTFILLLPATFAMGATLPALEQIYSKLFGPGRYVGGVYAANTFGSVAGTMLTTFMLTPRLGHSTTLLVCAVLNLLCAGSILRLFLRRKEISETRSIPPSNQRIREPGLRLVLLLLLAGFLGLSYEVLMIRVLSQILENTVFTFAIVLSIYLLGTAIGAAIYQRWLSTSAFGNSLRMLLVIASSVSSLGILVLWISDQAYEWLSALLYGSMTGAFIAEIFLASLVLLLPTMAMGALFSQLAQLATARFGFGHALAINTLAASFAPLFAGVLLLPAVGPKAALLIVSIGYLLMLVWPPFEWNSQTFRALTIPLALAAILLFLPPLRFVNPPEGGKLLETRDGVMAAVSVVSDDTGTRYLKVDNHFSMGSTATGFADHRQTHIPLLLYGDPKTALFLGVGTGMSLDPARYYPHLETTAVELVPENLDMMHYFGTDPKQTDWVPPPNLLASDARRFIVSGSKQFDVIIADLFHPSRDGAGSLYTAEHFGAIKQRLTPDGLFCQWLPLFQMDLNTFKLIARTFLDQFPYVQVHIPHNSLQQPIVGLIGSLKPLKYSPGWLRSKVHSPPLQQELTSLHLDSDLALFGGFLSDESGLKKFVGDGPLNTDNHPLVTYWAPRFAYLQEQRHGERLVTLVDALSRHRGTLLSNEESTSPHAFNKRMSNYLRARDAYLHLGLGVNPMDGFTSLIAKTRDPLLEIVRISNDFSSAYMPLLGMAESLYEIDPSGARKLLVDLEDAAPSRQEASMLLQALNRN